jgi:TPR repeat protein
VRLNPVNGIKYLKGAAEMGNSFAQWKLALCFKSGTGVNKDSLEADRWFAKAAEKGFDQGLPWPCINPAFRFDTVLKMFQAMADLTNKQAQHWLGVCYERGRGVPVDLDKAMHWYKLAAAKSYPPAQADVLRLAKK